MRYTDYTGGTLNTESCFAIKSNVTFGSQIEIVVRYAIISHSHLVIKVYLVDATADKELIDLSSAVSYPTILAYILVNGCATIL